MLHLFLRRHGGTRKNPLLGAILGALSALAIAVATSLQRHDGAHWQVSLAVIVAIAIVGAVIARFILLSRNGDGK